MTAGGVIAWADLGLRLVERFLGLTVMLDTARFMNMDPPGREQQFYSDFVPRLKHGDGAILKAQHWLSAQREQPIAVADISRYAGLEPRTFLRRFVSATGMKPSEYQQRLRMTRAREMLEFSRTSIDNINRFYVRSANGGQVPLGSDVFTERGGAPLLVKIRQGPDPFPVQVVPHGSGFPVPATFKRSAARPVAESVIRPVCEVETCRSS